MRAVLLSALKARTRLGEPMATQEQQNEATRAHDHDATYPQGDTEGLWVVCAWSGKFHHLYL